MEKPKGYRGPPPRKDLVISPCKERDWKGNDLFGKNNNITMNGEQKTTINTPANLGFEFGGPDDEYVDPHLKSQRDYGSDYAKLAMQGGHKDLLRMEDDSIDTSRKQKGCDNISVYNKMAQGGGHKDLLRMDGENDLDTGRKQKGCDNISEYTKIALQGGHKDLLVIEENKPTNRVQYKQSGGDWFKHADSDSPKLTKSISKPTPTPQPVVQSTSPAKPFKPRQQASSGSVFGGPDDAQPAKFGKKRFDQSSERREAPFATTY